MGTLGSTGRHKLLADLVLTKILGLHLVVYDWSTLGIHLVYMQQPRRMTLNTLMVATGIASEHQTTKKQSTVTQVM